MNSPHLEHLSHRHSGGLRGELIHFLNENLRSGAGFSIEQEYPSLFGDYPGGDSFVLRHDNRIASHVGVVVRQFQHQDYRFKVGIVGSVATAPEFRNRGYAKQLITRCLSELRRRGCALGILWTDNQDFYRGFGFFPMGREIDFRFSASGLPETQLKPTEFDLKKHGAYIWRLYQKHDVKVDRSLEEQHRLFKVPRVKIYVTEHKDQVSSYLVLNKGADFRDYIHEWGGDIGFVQQMVCWLQAHEYTDRHLTLIAPAHYPISAFRQVATWETPGIMGYFKLLERRTIVSTYAKYLARQSLSFRLDPDYKKFSIEGRDIPFETDEEVLQVVFGNANSDATPRLPFFLWGFDSI